MKNKIQDIIVYSIMLGISTYFLLDYKKTNYDKKKNIINKLDSIYTKRLDSLYNVYLKKEVRMENWDSVYDIYSKQRDSIDEIYQTKRKIMINELHSN